MSNLDYEFAALVLADAIHLGDRGSAEKHGCTDRTVRGYRALLKTDPKLSALFQGKVSRAERGWSIARTSFLRKALAKAEQLVDAASDIEHLPHVTEAIKAVGELQITVEAIGSDASDEDERSEHTGSSGEGSEAREGDPDSAPDDPES